MLQLLGQQYYPKYPYYTLIKGQHVYDVDHFCMDLFNYLRVEVV